MSTIPKRYTRFELMDTTGRVVVHYGNTQSLEQDECRTLKVFIDQPARAKHAELIQQLLDALEQSRRDGRGALSITMLDAIDAATEAGFKPTEP